jgi:DNA-binding NtrC family response regulator
MMPTDNGADRPGNRPRLLLIDDEPYILEALRRQLQSEPYDVQAFNDPFQALESFFQGGDCAIIVSDNVMPGLKGLELLARAKEFLPRTRRVLLTGHTDLNDAIDAFNTGIIHRFLNKPWDTNDLRNVLLEEWQVYQRDQGAPAEGDAGPSRPGGASAELQQTVHELKQALTQVALHEDSNQTRRLRITPQLKRLGFLIVDENQAVRRLLMSTLQKAGIMSVKAVESAEQAMQYLRSAPPVDVVLSEWGLPGLDGMALFEALRAGQTPSAKAMFILMTTRENRKEVEYALKSGVDYYLIKPFHLDTLVEQIDKHIRSGRKDLQEDRLAKLRPLHFVISNLDQDSRYKIQQILLLNGIQTVTIADSGAKALRVVKERKVDAMILDCNLMDIHWDHLRARLAELSGERRPPTVIATSVSPLPNEFEHVYGGGITSFLPGAIRQRDLFDAIFKALEDDERHDILGSDG